MNAVIAVTCEVCGGPTTAADAVPDARIPGSSPGQAGYRYKPLCWFHAAEHRRIATSRVVDALICEKQGIARVDHGRAGGDCVCEICGRTYYRHPVDQDYEFLNVLCDGSVVKL